MLVLYRSSGHCSMQRQRALGAALAYPSPRAWADLMQSRQRANQELCWAPLAARGHPAGAEEQLHPAQPRALPRLHAAACHQHHPNVMLCLQDFLKALAKSLSKPAEFPCTWASSLTPPHVSQQSKSKGRRERLKASSDLRQIPSLRRASNKPNERGF